MNEMVTIPKTEYEQFLNEKPLKADFIKQTESLRNEMNSGKKIRFISVDEMEL